MEHEKRHFCACRNREWVEKVILELTKRSEVRKELMKVAKVGI